jgi:DNA-binding phage protein
MQKRKAKRVYRELSPAETEKLRRARQETDEDRAEIEEKARRAKAEHDRVLCEIREAVEALRCERTSQGLSLQDIKERSGFSRSSLCRLENDIEPNPTISTLMRYADALGKRLVITLEERK